MPAADLEELTRDLGALVCEVRDQGAHSLGCERIYDLFGQDRFRHSGSGDRRDGVYEDAVLASLDGERIREAELRELRARVVGLSEVAVET